MDWGNVLSGERKTGEVLLSAYLKSIGAFIIWIK